MPGPYMLRLLHLFVNQRSPGAFILSRNGRTADLVGSSRDDIGRALGSFRNRSAYRYFWFAYAASAEEASGMAHAWYHRYRPSDNMVPPEGMREGNWRCTSVGCTACALAEAKV